MENSRVAPTTIDLQLLVIDSNAKREMMRTLWFVLSLYLWSLYTSILIVWTSACEMKIFGKGEGFYIFLGLTVVASVMSVYICIAAIGIIFYIRLLHTRRFDILRTWSLSKPLTILSGPVDFDAILLPLRRPDDHHASEESLHSSSMGDSHGVQAAVNIDGVRALSQNVFVILLFDTINGNDIFQQDHHQPSPLITLPV
ncbi:hypothetical protein ABFS83_04G229500 [Erythranthe nasuta]